MASMSIRRPPMRMMEKQPPPPQDENATPTASCSASPTRLGVTGHVRSPSKLPTLSDIAARLNRDRETNSTPTGSPAKHMESPRLRLELTGRISGSPAPPQVERKSPPLMPDSPNKGESMACASPKAPCSGACSPSKRMLAKGLPSLEEIRDRMSRKGLCPKSTENKKVDEEATPSSPKKLESDMPTNAAVSAEKRQVSASASLSGAEHDKMAVNEPSPVASKPVLKVATSSTTIPKLTHPLPAPPKQAASYLLQHEWTLFFDSRSAGETPSSGSQPTTPTLSTSLWEANLRTIGSYRCVETFLGCFAKLRRPSQLERHSSYHVFKDGIKPMWEDARNAEGGKWVITFRNRNPALVDRSWLWLVLALIGEQMDERDEVCGGVCSVKPRGDRIAVWVRDRRNVESVNRIGRKLISLLELEKEPGIVLEFSAHVNKGDGEDKLEGVYSLNNQQNMARSPTISTFNADANAERLVSTAPMGAPTSPGGKRPVAQRSPISSEAGASGSPFGRLNGQPSSLGQSLGLGLGLGIGMGMGTSTPPLSSSPGARHPFQQPPQKNGGSWRRNTSTSPHRRPQPFPPNSNIEGGSRPASPTKPN